MLGICVCQQLPSEQMTNHHYDQMMQDKSEASESAQDVASWEFLKGFVKEAISSDKDRLELEADPELSTAAIEHHFSGSARHIFKIF